jgi:hypothetical protein
LDGKVGNFPSLVVDECDENGELLNETEEEEEDDEEYTAPPAGFGLPPTIPSHLLSQEDLNSSIDQQSPMPDKKMEIDFSQTSQKPAFQPPSGSCHHVLINVSNNN